MWQGHPKFKSKQNLISKIYPKRAEDKEKEKRLGRWTDKYKNEKKVGVGFVGAYWGNRKSFVLEKNSLENTVSVNIFLNESSFTVCASMDIINENFLF